MKLKRLISNSVTIIMFLILILFFIAVITSKASGGEPSIFGYQLKTVLSGSMEPDIKTGSIIVVKPGGDMKRFKKGDIITYKTGDDVVVTHRVIKVLKDGNEVSYQTKGDNNKTVDMTPVPSNMVVAEYTGLTIPYLGYLADYTKTKTGSALLLILPGILLVLYSGISIWRTLSQLENKIRKSSDADNIEKPI
ncbi:signal peptidase I SipW [Neobacillus thermocopriae]|uniref:Signal peptidase I n=1 Tax=Neobacillus thermocopriae TaxID=1215031 RepID=A0A6B3TTG3_9BACI|nr:signal peptidase I [Neobacillus thermocopriae]MED3625485.1 signal peptidase I [Neobacillus thermocopriae]MED3714598.1 signal peptidase I [Neobacillus thermocopriae]NEX78957.1 signal peptidase I [Neobacillus thermocopriae]